MRNTNVSNKKKILYIHHGKGLGGAPLSLLYLIQNLDKAQYEPIVLFLHYSEAVELYKKQNIPIAGIVNRHDFSHTKVWWQRWYHLPRLAKITYDTIISYYHSAPYWLKKINPDLIHLNTSSLIAWGKAAHKVGIPVVWHIREPLAHGYLGVRKNIVQNHVKNYASAIVAISHNDSLPWKKEKHINIVHNPVDAKVFDHTIALDNIAIEKDKPTILYLGGLSQEKGVLPIFQAFETLLEKMPEAQLIIAGYFNVTDLTNPTFYRKVSSLASLYKKVNTIYQKTKHAIKILGPITNVPEIMGLSDVVVFPATIGHFARPIIEAGFMKKPVIASNLPPLNELIIQGETGFLIDPVNTDKWSSALYKLLSNKQLQITMGEKGYQFCTKNFEATVQAKKVETIYHNILSKG